MGFLTAGLPLSYEDTKKVSNYIRIHGVSQFLCTWNRVKDIANDELKFGDEIECGIFMMDPENKTVQLSVRAAELRTILNEKEASVAHQSEGVTWHPEFGGWMIESTPSRPYTHYASDLLRIERNMVLRRRRLLSVLQDNEIAPTVTCFMLMGVGDFIHNPLPFEAPHSMSEFIPDYIINPHPRFAALTRNIRARRGSKVDISVPLFRDVNTPEFMNAGLFIENDENPQALQMPPGYKLEPDTNIHMDCMAFGMGMCCLQVTFQGRDLDESRYMYDQLAVLAPIMLAMTAATPIFKGRLSNVDARWDIIAQSCDDRTPYERGEIPVKVDSNSTNSEEVVLGDSEMAGNGVERIYKSRYDSVSTYIYHCKGDPTCKRTFEVYNDIPCAIDRTVKDRLKSAGVDENLSHHLAHLFTRDPLVVYAGKVDEVNDEASTEHFENIQSTNWQTCRWKPPPPRVSPEDPHIGWRTEFRSMEVQLTDFENAAFVTFVVLVTRVLLSFDLALYIPLSKVDENMHRAQQVNAIMEQKYYFRKHVAPPELEEEVMIRGAVLSRTQSPVLEGSPEGIVRSRNNSRVALNSESAEADRVRSRGNSKPTPYNGPCLPCFSGTKSPSQSNLQHNHQSPQLCANDSFEEMTADEIFNGKDEYYPGLIPLVYAYLDFVNCDAETFTRVDAYLRYIADRARGKIITPATWMRNYVREHPAYKQDSIISPEIAHDLLKACSDIGSGNLQCPEILGDITIERVRPEDAYGSVLAGKLNSEEERSELLDRLMQRAFIRRDETSPRGTSSSKI